MGGLVLAAVAGLLVGGVLCWLIASRRSAGSAALPAEPPSGAPAPTPSAMRLEGLGNLLSAIPGAAIVVNSRNGFVVAASSEAGALGLVQGDRIVVSQVASMVGDVHRGAARREEEVEVKRTPFAAARTVLLTTVVPLDSASALVLAEDITGARRVEAVRRDFVANVSHELKTPVGALSLLSEAVLAAADEPDEVRHFAGRMQVESARLAHLVTDLVDLSRLQGDDPMEYAESIEVDAVIAEAVDSMRTTAQSRDIEIFVGGDRGVHVFGVESQLVTALRNLLANAVAYSPDKTRVAISCRSSEDGVQITVTDQGIGIPAGEIDRVFERFYRVDQARSRVTGGTGLGLAIVKHVCQNHGGSVTVWSVEGEGSTFTVRLPTLEQSRAGMGSRESPAADAESAQPTIAGRPPLADLTGPMPAIEGK